MSNLITTHPPKNAGSATLTGGILLSGTACILYGLMANNTNAAAQYIQLHDTATVPADGAVPVLCIRAPAADNEIIDLGVFGMLFVNGLYACNSSTPAVKTIGAADCQFFARLRNQ